MADLAPLIAKLGAGDRSVLEATIAEANAEMITSEGSANDELWSAFAARGWMTSQPPPEGGPAGIKLKMFSLTDEGRKQIPLLLRRSGQP